MNPDLVDRIEGLIAQALSAEDPWVAGVAKDYHALTVYCDLGGCLAVRPDGEILCIPDDPATPAHIEADPIQRNLALVQASRRYAELKGVYPVRPRDARSCSDCGGTGIHPITSHAGFEAIICRCGGTGWLPAGIGPGA
jgi:hypothetical protein